ncbi:hypothetical protein ACHAW6_007399 [Cyclotella cf. meneghiniana]
MPRSYSFVGLRFAVAATGGLSVSMLLPPTVAFVHAPLASFPQPHRAAVMSSHGQRKQVAALQMTMNRIDAPNSFVAMSPKRTPDSNTHTAGPSSIASFTVETSHAKDPSSSFLAESPTKSPPEKEVWIARLLLVLSAALYGTNFTMVKSLDESLSVGVSSTLRFGFAALSMLPWLFAPIDDKLKVIAKEKSQKVKDELGMLSWEEEPTRLAAGLAGMEIGMYNAIGYISQAVGLKTIPANKSAFICSMAVVTVPILDFLFGKQLLKRQVLGAALAAIGVWVLEMGGQQGGLLSSGDLVSLAQPVMFGLGFWRMEAAMEKYPTEAGRLAAAQLLMVFFVSLSYLICRAPIEDTYEVIPTMTDIMSWLHDPHVLGMLFWTGVVTTAFTIWMETLALKTLSAAETTLIFSTEPLFGTAFAAMVANECFGKEAAIGAAFIIGGCLVSGIDLNMRLPPMKWNRNEFGWQSKHND